MRSKKVVDESECQGVYGQTDNGASAMENNMEEQDVMNTVRTAIANGDMEQANRLLNENNNIIRELTASNGTLLHDAVRYNQKELASRLIDIAGRFFR